MATTQVPDSMTPEEAYENLQTWYALKQKLLALKEQESSYRKAIAAYYFAQPREGVNRLDLGGGYDLKLDFGYDYKVDEAALDAVTKTDIKKYKLSMDTLVVYKPSLSLRAFNDLSDEQRAFVEEAFLEKKEKSPQLNIVPQTGAQAPTVEETAPAPRTRKPRTSTPRKRSR